MCSRSVVIIQKKEKVNIFNNKGVMELFRNSGTPVYVHKFQFCLINVLNQNFKQTISHIVELRQKTTDQVSF
jgi:hypothetical protein